MAGAGVAPAGALLEVVLPPEGQLAMAWEANPVIRQQMRDDGRLLQWPNKATTGVASQPALVMNRTAIQVALTEWATVCGEPKSLPIDWVREEVHVGHTGDLDYEGILKCYNYIGSLKVKKLHSMFLKEPDVVDMCVDHWGVKRLVSLAVRRYRSGINAFRDCPAIIVLCAIGCSLQPVSNMSVISWIP